MILTVDVDASYLSESDGRCRAGGLAYFGSATGGHLNGPVHHTSVILPTVVTSAAEAEYAAVVLSSSTGHRPTSPDSDRYGPPRRHYGYLRQHHRSRSSQRQHLQAKGSRAIDMRYHWVRDRVKLVWRSNRFSLADYLTKCHPARHCLYMCQFYFKPIRYMLLRLLRLLRLRHPLPPRRAVTDILSPSMVAKDAGRKRNQLIWLHLSYI